MPRGPKPQEFVAWETHIHLRLRVGEDDDIIAFFNDLPNRKRASALKAALRAGGMQAPHETNSDLENELISAANDFLK